MGIELVSDFDIMALFAIGLSVTLAYLFQEYLIPRGLSGLQVAISYRDQKDTKYTL